MKNASFLHSLVLLIKVVVLVEVFIVDLPLATHKIPPTGSSCGSCAECHKDVDLDLKNTTKSDLLKAFLVMA